MEFFYNNISLYSPWILCSSDLIKAPLESSCACNELHCFLIPAHHFFQFPVFLCFLKARKLNIYLFIHQISLMPLSTFKQTRWSFVKMVKLQNSGHLIQMAAMLLFYTSKEWISFYYNWADITIIQQINNSITIII